MMLLFVSIDENNPGGYGYGDAAKYNTFGVNPIARENLEKRHMRQNRLNGSLWLEFKPFEFLSYKFNGGVDLYFYEIHGFVVKVIGNKIRNIVIRRARKHVIILIIC